MTDEATARARLGPQDFQAYLRATQRKGILLTLAGGVLALVAIVARILLPVFTGRPLDTIALWLLDSVVVYFVTVVLWSNYSWYRRSPAEAAASEDGETLYRFGPGGVSSSDGHGTSTLRWTRFKRVVELPELYHLEIRPGVSVLVPRRGFATPHDESRFRFLVRAAGLPLVDAQGRPAAEEPAPAYSRSA